LGFEIVAERASYIGIIDSKNWLFL